MTIKLYKALLKAYSELGAQVEAARKKLAARCKHPVSWVEDRTRTRGDGYGGLTTITYKACKICRFEAWWGSGNWHDPSKQISRNDD